MTEDSWHTPSNPYTSITDTMFMGYVDKSEGTEHKEEHCSSQHPWRHVNPTWGQCRREGHTICIPKVPVSESNRKTKATGNQVYPTLTSRTSRCSFVFISSDLIRSFLAVSRSSSSSAAWLDREARRSFIWLCSLACLSMTSCSSSTLARSSWLKEPSEDRWKA